MKKLLAYALLSIATSAPVLSFAQSSAPVTHALLISELAQLEKAGYNPSGDDANYPADIDSAEVKLSAGKLIAAGARAVHSVGGVTDTDSSSGTYTANACVGPYSFCNIYAGS